MVSIALGDLGPHNGFPFDLRCGQYACMDGQADLWTPPTGGGLAICFALGLWLAFDIYCPVIMIALSWRVNRDVNFRHLQPMLEILFSQPLFERTPGEEVLLWLPFALLFLFQISGPVSRPAAAAAAGGLYMSIAVSYALSYLDLQGVEASMNRVSNTSTRTP